MSAETSKKISMKDRQLELRENTILAAARELLSKKGFAAMTLEDVISEVGISKPTFYQHFTSKEQLAVSVLIREISDTCGRLKEYEATLPPDQAIKAMIGWTIDQHFGSCTYYDFTSMVPLCAHQKIRGAECEIIEMLAGLIARAQKEGSIKSTGSPKMIAQFLNSILKDAAYLDEIKRERITLAELKLQVEKLLLG